MPTSRPAARRPPEPWPPAESPAACRRLGGFASGGDRQLGLLKRGRPVGGQRIEAGLHVADDALDPRLDVVKGRQRHLDQAAQPRFDLVSSAEAFSISGPTAPSTADFTLSTALRMVSL
jgi:hypothetical protein